MTQKQGYFFEDLSEGMTDSYSRTITEDDIQNFGDVSGDFNAVHFDEDYAKTTMFKGRIAHGMLSAAYISTAIGTKLPGPGSIYVSQTMRFKAPVRIGDTVEARVTLTKLIPQKKFAEFTTQCFVGDKMVLDGEATIMVPSKLVPSKS